MDNQENERARDIGWRGTELDQGFGDQDDFRDREYGRDSLKKEERDAQRDQED